MSAASLIGFGAVFLLACWGASAALAMVLHRAAPRRPALERRAASLAAALPVALGAGLVVILVVQSLLGEDHCLHHDHHAHLCLVHGGAWASRTWAVALVAVGGAVALVRGAALGFSMLRGLRLLRPLRRAAALGLARRQGELIVVPSERPFCFVAGLRHPRIFASTAARAALAEDEWQAMLAHERGHIAHRDLRHRLRLELLLLLAAPRAGAILRAHWDAATEQLRDADAAERTAPEVVASALVRMSRAALQLRTAQLASFATPADGGLARRVASLLDLCPRGEREAQRMARLALLAMISLAVLAFALAEPMHHALEDLIG